MDYLTIEGVKPYDGRYEFDIENHALTTREWGWIKRHSGYLPLTIADGYAGADPELYAVFAVIALCRAGKVDARDAGLYTLRSMISTTRRSAARRLANAEQNCTA